ncbi:MAG TPA: UDP-N-acetylmuramate--L-alanine ligase, partial [Nitrospiria bacterium]|nr:UDP-N-acetylmuramate--L-alanine ligase [Nitrospiria bacterium]
AGGGFQPHRYTRTRDLLGEFADAFALADRLILTEIYAAGERPIPGISGEALYEKVRAQGHPDVTFLPKLSEVVPYLRGNLKGGEMVMTLGAGDIWKVGKTLLEGL